MATKRWPKTLQEAIVYFSDPDTAFEEIVKFRWPDGIVRCPVCRSTEVYFTKSRHVWQCKLAHKRRQFSVKIGSIMEDSPLSIDKWLVAVWLITNAKNGISSYELSRAIGITQKSAWFMLHRIRLAMQDKMGGKIGGEVEVDETYIGGKARNMHTGRRKRIIKSKTGVAGKAAVMGLLDRHSGQHSTVRYQMLGTDTTKPTMNRLVREQVREGSVVYTDAFKSYDGLSRDYVHQVIDHANAYVDGQIHTNGLENFWSLLKRCIRGTYVSVEPFHLFRYLDEQAFRFNTRKLTDATRFAITAAAAFGKRLTFKELTAADARC